MGTTGIKYFVFEGTGYLSKAKVTGKEITMHSTDTKENSLLEMKKATTTPSEAQILSVLQSISGEEDSTALERNTETLLKKWDSRGLGVPPQLR